MKQITYAGTSIITGTAVAEALIEYATTVASTMTTVAVEIPVLEENGKITTHTLMIGPATQFGVTDVDGLPVEDEVQRFAVPHFPPVAQVASPSSSGAAVDAARFNEAIADVESSG